MLEGCAEGGNPRRDRVVNAGHGVAGFFAPEVPGQGAETFAELGLVTVASGTQASAASPSPSPEYVPWRLPNQAAGSSVSLL